MYFSILYVVLIFSTALLVLHVATVQLQKYLFLNCKEPVEDPWSYLQPPGKLGEKTSFQNSHHGHQANCQQTCLCVFTAKFEHPLLAELLCQLFFIWVNPRLLGQQSRNLNCFRGINIS